MEIEFIYYNSKENKYKVLVYIGDDKSWKNAHLFEIENHKVISHLVGGDYEANQKITPFVHPDYLVNSDSDYKYIKNTAGLECIIEEVILNYLEEEEKKKKEK